MEYYIKVIKNYAVFNGRASRKEFWRFSLIDFLVILLTLVLDRAFGFNVSNHNGFITYHEYGYIQIAYMVALFIPRIALIVRRLHDIERSGWWVLILAIPILGFLVLLAYSLLPGMSGYNDYGADPKMEEISN